MINPNKDYYIHEICKIERLDSIVQVKSSSGYIYQGHTDHVDFKPERFSIGSNINVWLRFSILTDSFKIVKIQKNNKNLNLIINNEV